MSIWKHAAPGASPRSGLSILLIVGLMALGTPASAQGPDRGIAISEAPFRTFGRSVTARCFVQVPPKAVFEVLADHDRLAEFMPLLEEARALESKPGWARVRFRVRFMGMFDIVEIDERTIEPYRRIGWHASEGALRVSDGSWTLTPRGDGTELVYQTDVDPGIPLPPALVGYLMRQGLPELVESVRKRAESGGKWRKGGASAR